MCTSPNWRRFFEPVNYCIITVGCFLQTARTICNDAEGVVGGSANTLQSVFLNTLQGWVRVRECVCVWGGGVSVGCSSRLLADEILRNRIKIPPNRPKGCKIKCTKCFPQDTSCVERRRWYSRPADVSITIRVRYPMTKTTKLVFVWVWVWGGRGCRRSCL